MLKGTVTKIIWNPGHTLLTRFLQDNSLLKTDFERDVPRLMPSCMMPVCVVPLGVISF